MKKFFIIFLFLIPALLHANVVVPVNRSISTDTHKWTFESVELAENFTVCHWSVESLTDMTYVQMTPGVYLLDDKGNKLFSLYCNLPMTPERKILYSEHGKVEFLVIFPLLGKNVRTISYYSNENFRIDNINLNPVGTKSEHPLLSPFFKKKGVNYTTTKENTSCRITDVIKTEDRTEVIFEYVNMYDKDGWCNIDKGTCIVPDKTGRKLIMIKAEGIEVAPAKHGFRHKGETLNFKLIFPAITDGSSSFDLIESTDSNWKFYGVSENKHY